MKALQEEAEKYAMHYAKDFVTSTLRKEQSFQEHYERLKFDRHFFEGILYTIPAISGEFSEKRLELLRENLDEQQIDHLVKKEEQRFLKQIEHDFKGYFAEFYIEEIDLAMADCEEELLWAKDDYRYHENREYLQDKDYVGEVSEEERSECMQEAQEKINRWEEKKQRLEHLKQEIEQLLSTS